MKRNISAKGEYGIDFSFNNNEVRNYQELLNKRNKTLNSFCEGFGTPEHKMEFVKTIRDIDFINDAASCNANSIYMAFSNAVKKVTWITHFKQWGEVSGDFLQMMMQKVSHIIFIGEYDYPSIAFVEALHISTNVAADIETAVRKAFYATPRGEAILYCPGNALQEGESINDRGTLFKNAVAQL